MVNMTENEALAKILEGNEKLHAFIDADAGESDEAEAVRDEMDYWWSLLTGDQQDAARVHRANCYALREGRPLVAHPLLPEMKDLTTPDAVR